MKQEIAERLSAALRSGEFKQATGQLCKRSITGMVMGHCCLGVLSELAVQDGIVDTYNYDYAVRYASAEEMENDTYGESLPPASVGDWAGLIKRDAYSDYTIFFDVSDHPKILADPKKDRTWYKFDDRLIIPAHELNDEFGFTFEEIADLIDNGKIVTELPKDEN